MPIPFLSSIGLNKNEVQDFKVFNLASDPTLTSGGDYGYFWLNTTNSGGTIPTLKWWDGTNVRSLVDSTNIGSFTSGLATDLAGGGAGQIVYQDGANDTKFLAAGTTGQVLSSNGASAPSWLNQSSLSAGTAANISGGLAGQLLYQSAIATTAKLTIGTAGQALVVNAGATAPEWVDQSTFSVGSATNKPGGNVGDILVQSGSGTTGFLNVGTTGQVITSNGASPQYVNQSTLSVGSATTSGTATNIAGGAANRIPYQTAAGTTAFITDAANAILTTNASSVPALTAATNVTVGKAVDIALGAAGDLLYQSASNDTSFLNIGANGSILTSTGTAPQWSTSIPSGSVSGLAASATTDTTSASNISSGTLGLARLALATGQFYVGDASNNPAATLKSSIPLSGFGAAGADVAMGGFKITGLDDPEAGTDAANKDYVDSVAQGLDVKASCKVGTIANITLSGPGASIDGISLSVDDRVLVKNQTDKKENGIYLWKGAALAMVRSADADTVAKLTSAFTFVEQGTNADSGWVCTVNSGTIGSVDIEWEKFSQAGSYTQGRGMVLDGTAFNFAQSTNYTADTIPYASGATTIGFIGAGTADQVLRVPGAGGTPAFGAIDLTKSAAVTGALPAANGGTGQSTYAVGDILFADGATSLAKLADVATGNALISGGVTTAPSWGKIGLTTHVSGTLPVGNGGTGATTFTAGRVLFGNGTSALNTSANLFWDNSNNRLGIGTATPATKLHINGEVALPLSNLIYWNAYYGTGAFRNIEAGKSGYIATLSDGSLQFSNTTDSAASADQSISFSERLRIASDGVCTWSNVGGVAGTAMTLNGTGLGVGATPSAAIHSAKAAAANPTGGSAAGAGLYVSNVNPLYGMMFGVNGGGVGWIQQQRSDTNTQYDLSLQPLGGNVGIGTPTPAATLDVNGASTLRGNITVASGATSYGTLFITSSLIELQANSNATNGLRFKTTSATPITLFTNDTERLRIDSSGNLGLGVTPNTWAAVFKAIQFPDGYAAIAGDNGNGVAEITSNAYNDGAWKFRNAQGAVRYRLDAINKAHTWFNTSTTPTANGAITWTPAMVLDASGNLALGTSTANFRADIQNASGAAVLRLKGGTGAAQGSAVYMTYAGGANTLLGIGDRATILGGTPDQLACIYSGVALTFEVNGLERLRIKSTGQVNFVGLASDPAGAAGDVVYNSTSNRLKYHNGTAWVDSGTRKYVVQLNDGSVTVAGNAYTLTHNFGTQDVTVSIRRTTDNAVVQADVVMPAGGNTVTVTFAAAITAAEFYVTVIG